MSTATATHPLDASVANPGARLVELIKAQPPDAKAIAAYLDGLDHEQRLQAVGALGGGAIQGRLWEAVAGNPPLALDDFVPRDAKPFEQVIFHGKNSLPAFTVFQKRFCRAPGRDELWGYNHQTLAWLTGPGYFVVHDDPKGTAIDYRQVPGEQPPPSGWPAVKPNEAGLSRFVYANMVDYMRRVSRDVLIGAAYKNGKPFNSWFVLCRQP